MVMQRRLLFVTLSNIGDLVLTTPSLMALHEAWPDALIDVVADRRSSDLLRHAPFVGDIHHREKDAGLRVTLSLVATLRRHRYEAIVDLRTDFLPFLLRARHSATRWRARDIGPHAAQEHFAVARQVLPRAIEVPSAVIWTSPDAARSAQERLSSVPGRRLVLAPGANWAGKCWPLPRYIELAQRLSTEFDSLLLFGSEAERAATEAIAQTVAIPTLNLAGRTSLLDVAALLPHCHAFIGNDSGLGHMAAASKVPTLTIFGPGNPSRYRPWGPEAGIICAPEANLQRLEVEVVAQALRGHLARIGGPQ
jgi:ADP-heptose:LPS heptosyltransferase